MAAKLAMARDRMLITVGNRASGQRELEAWCMIDDHVAAMVCSLFMY